MVTMTDKLPRSDRLPDWRQIMAHARSDIQELAASVGIDGNALLDQLPEPGCLLKGNQVPVISRRDKGVCSVLFHLNQTRHGSTWPLLWFHTFRHGEMTCTFNGLRWWLSQSRPLTVLPHRSPIIARRSHVINDYERIRRQRIFQALYAAYTNAPPATTNTPLLYKRLGNALNDSLLQRLTLRVIGWRGEEVVAAPIYHPVHGLVGFQCISQTSGQKRVHLRGEGMMRGSAVLIAAATDLPALHPVGICEGLITGLSLATVWPGTLYVALCAGNLAAVRQSISAPAVFFHDQDIWKPQVGNVGLIKATAAARPGDRLIGPVFSKESLARRPTDFNDLLQLEGLSTLMQQVHRR